MYLNVGRLLASGYYFCVLSAVSCVAVAPPPLAAAPIPEENELAAQIYRDYAGSVFVVSAYDAQSSLLSFGSGFAIGKNTVVTSLHVVATGTSILVGQGETRQRANILKRDILNDLAILTLADATSAKPLLLSEREPTPGESIYTIGNPDGLEKSISVGVVAGLRNLDGRSLLQITAPISHGSSGGPVMNANGEVIGITAAMFSDGQNLNFAVPTTQLKHLIAGDASPQATVSALLAKTARLREAQKNASYSNDPGSSWQQATAQIDSLLRSAMQQAGDDPDLLLKIAEEAKYGDRDVQIDAAEYALRQRQTPQLYILLGEALASKAEADSTQAGLLSRAEDAFRSAIKIQASASAYHDLARVLEQQGMLFEPASSDQFVMFLKAKDNYLKALNTKKASTPKALKIDTWRGLVRLAARDRDVVPDQATYFELLVKNGATDALDWEYRADFLSAHGEFKKAGEAYLEAAKRGAFWESWCNAANEFWGFDRFGKISENERSWNLDRVLSTARKCVEYGNGSTGLPQALVTGHQMIFNVLYARGVYSEALSHAKKAAEIDSSNPWLFHDEAEALYKLRQFDDAIQASSTAVRLSDGKYEEMHFQLGLSHFETRNWEFALQSFEKAAELDTSNAPAAFDAGLCHLNLGHSRDALKWFRDVLRRDPKYENRDEVQRQINLIEKAN